MIVEDIIRDGGATLDGATLEPVHPTEGYAVAIHRGTAVKVALAQHPARLPNPLIGPVALAQAIIAVRDTHRSPFVGVWIEDAGLYSGSRVAHVDPVVILPDQDSAFIVARAFAQEAVYSFFSGSSLYVADRPSVGRWPALRSPEYTCSTCGRIHGSDEPEELPLDPDPAYEEADR